MSKNLYVIPKMPLPSDQRYDKDLGCLTLSDSGSFCVEIIPSDTFHQDAPKKLPPFTKLTQDQVFNMPRWDDRKHYIALHNEREAKEKKYAEELQAYNQKVADELATLSWCWETVGNTMKGKTLTHNASFTKGMPEKHLKYFVFPKLLVGGGCAWLEAFSDHDPATGKIPEGLFVRAIGNPVINNIIWTDTYGKPITKKVKFGSKVMLNIYTTDMYGHDLEVTLWDKDAASLDDQLPASNMQSFTCEVLTTQIQDHELGQKGVSGDLELHNENQTHVQVAKISVVIDIDWIFIAGTDLIIYPTVKSLDTGNFLKVPKDCYLEVSTYGKKYEPKREPVNNLAFIGKVETNIASFRPCRYDKIELKNLDTYKITTFFDSSKNEQRAIKTIDINIIAGKKEKYTLDIDFHTIECTKEPCHHNEEVSILSIPIDYELQNNTESKQELAITEAEKVFLKPTFNNNASIFGINTKLKNNVIAKEEGLVILNQNKIEFDAFYNYDIPQDKDALTTFYKAMKYFSITDLSNIPLQKIILLASTCAFEQHINIAIYPDIKWTLKFGFNVEKHEIENLNRKGGNFASLKTYQDKADQRDKANFEVNQNNTPKVNSENQRRKETLENATKYFTEQYDLKPQEKNVNPVREGTSFKEIMAILNRITISLEEEHYGGTVKNELTDKFVKQLYELTRNIPQIIETAISIIEGSFDQKPFTPDHNKNIEGLMSRLQRKPVEYKMLYPKISCAASWFYEVINGKHHPELAGKTGVGIDVMLKAAPLIGMAIQWDILELLCRRHPIAYSILKAIDALIYILFDDTSAITCNFTVSGQIDTTLDFQYNKLAGFKEIHKQGKSSIKTALEFKINIANTYKTLGYETIVNLGFGASAAAGLGITDTFGIDSDGLFMKQKIEFEGIKLSFSATGIIQFKNEEETRKNKKALFEIASSIQGEITFLNCKYETDKIYLLS